MTQAKSRGKRPSQPGGRRRSAPRARPGADASRRLPRNSEPLTLDIVDLGAKGDGIARVEGEDKPYYVRLAAPGDRLVARPTAETSDFVRAEIVELERQGADRADPPCPHFGPCGGCQLQHIATARYEAFKTEMVARALRSRGLDAVPLAPLFTVAPGTRRRATLVGRMLASGPLLGFHEPASHRIVAIDRCPLLTPALNALLPLLRERVLPLAAADTGGTLSFGLLDTASGPDLTIGAGEEPDMARRIALVDLARTLDLARISWQVGEQPPDPIAERRPVTVALSDVHVAPPPAAFLQATGPSEAAIVEAVMAALPPVERVADLFAGIGTFSLAAVGKAKTVTAIDGAADAVRALRLAADGHGLGGRVETEVRNLAVRPLLAAELDRYDAVIFDPPRAGAKEQAAELAASSVPLVIGVSCHPQTFARDARILVDGGFQLVGVHPVDQFLWSHHVEIVGVFERKGPAS